MDLAKQKKKVCMLFKVDFEKAYYYVSWNYLWEVMKIKGFGSKWFSWMETYIVTSSMTILINRIPTQEF